MVPTDHKNFHHYLKWIHTELVVLNTGHLGRPSNPAALIEPKRGRRWKWDPLPGAGSDRLHYYRRGAWLAAIACEPEDPAEEAAVMAYAAQYGLRVSTPPNPLASLRNPGVAKFILLTSPTYPKFWPGRWLPQQLEFQVHGHG